MTRAEEVSGSRAAKVAAAGLLLAYGVVLFAHRAAPSLTDYANWSYQGVLLRDHMLGLPDAAHALKPYPVPNSAATVGIGLLALLAPWKIAAKTWLCVQLGISFGTLRHLARTLGQSPAVWMIVPQAVFLNTNLWYGFVNFQLGLCWVLLTASLLLRKAREPDTRLDSRSGWKIGMVLLLAFFTHMIPFCFAALLVLLYAGQTRRWRVAWQLTPAVVASAWYVLGRYLVAGDADGQTGMQAAVKSYSAEFWGYKLNSWLKSFGFVNPEVTMPFATVHSVAAAVLGRGWFALEFAANLALFVALAWLMLQAARRVCQERAPERFLWAGVAGVMPLYLVLPGTALGVSDPGARLLQTALALAIPLVLGTGLAAPGGRALARLASGCAALLAVLGLWLFARAGFVPELPGSDGAPLPHFVVGLAHVPNHDQDYFYAALERGDTSLWVYPTGMFLNRR